LFPWIITLAVLELWRNDLLVRARLSILQIRRPAILVSTCLSIGVALLLLIGITRFPSALTRLLDWLKKLEHELPQSWQDLFVPMSPFQVLYFFVQVGLSIAWAAWLIGKRVRKGRAGPVVDHKLT
jgi:hypothetical protein